PIFPVRMKFSVNHSPVICPGPPRLTFVSGSVLYVNLQIKTDYYNDQMKHCVKWNILRSSINDVNITFTKPIIFNKSVNLDSEFCQIKCFSHNGSVLYTDYHSIILEKQRVQRKLKGQTAGRTDRDKPLSVLLFGIDSTSRNSFDRQMPDLKKFLVKKLKAYTYPGLTRVGKNTLPNVIPMLTGKFLNETKWQRKDFFDSLGFIWKNYSAKHAITFLAEDRPRTGAFNYLRRGFLKPPTDFYIRPLTIALAKNRTYPDVCIGSVSETEHVLHYTKQFFKLYGTSFYFAFMFFTDWTHEHLNGASRYEKELLNFFQWLYNSKLLNNTLVFFFGDHGFRFGGFRTTEVGSHEVNLPFSFLMVPEWFKTKHKSKVQNLDTNQNRLVTFFDVFATLSENLNRGDNSQTSQATTTTTTTIRSKRGISLLAPIPANRTCKDAEIPEGFCECFSGKKRLNVNDKKIIAIATTGVNFLNKRIEGMKKCAFLKLKKITNAFKYGNKYTITMRVLPSRGLFQFTAQQDNHGTHIKGDVLRINVYGNQSHCVNNPALKPMCFCV
ncbi:uncharacterized protein LOC115231360, partial [Argonauta hians]